jgi:hypothetical protein
VISLGPLGLKERFDKRRGMSVGGVLRSVRKEVLGGSVESVVEEC